MEPADRQARDGHGEGRGRWRAITRFAVDATTGVVTLEDAAPVGSAVTAGFEFDTPVRFDADRIEVTLEGFDAGRVVAVPLIEVRV